MTSMNVGIRPGCNAGYDAVCFLPHRQNSPSQSRELAERATAATTYCTRRATRRTFFAVRNALDMDVGRKISVHNRQWDVRGMDG